MSDASSHDEPGPASAPELNVLLHSRGYLRLLLLAALVGIPISAIAFGFLAAVHELEHVVWDSLPKSLGIDGPPAWWPIVALGLAGALCGLAVTRLPGHGGHVPAMGLAAGATPPSFLPGVALAAAASLVLGAVVGPEAPLIAIGSGLALIAVKRMNASDTVTAVIAAAGSAAAISAIFGNPLVGAVIFLEAVGLARRKSLLVILPCLVASGVGALVFTGLGDWTGLGIGALSIPNLQPAELVTADLVSAIPLAAVVATVMWAIFVVGRKTASFASTRPMATTVVAGLIAGCSAALYAVLTDHSPAEVAMSGQATLPALATHPEAWSAAALVLLVVCKGLAYAVCIGAFRGGSVFPAVFLGAAFGVLAGLWFPGVGTVDGLAIGMAAGAAVIGLPITSVLLVTLLLGSAATDLMPAIILAAVTALVLNEMLTSRRSTPTDDLEAASPAKP
jgi:H+/Cl- antiporter ClcA